MIKPYLYLRRSKLRGNGVFTREDIPAKTVIEIAPVVVLSVKEGQKVLATKLQNYAFKWGKSARKLAIALGWTSVYNHKPHSNAAYTADFKKNRLIIKTVREIKKGQEIFVNYHCDPEDSSPVWFNVK